MKLSRAIDLGRSLRQVFGDDPRSAGQVELDRDRQTATADAILRRFLSRQAAKRRELVILADEVGLGKTYVALAVAASLLDAFRCGEAVGDLPRKKPVVLVLTPTSDALFNKWVREAEAFRRGCARQDGALDWLQIEAVSGTKAGAGNVADMTRVMRGATRKRPMLMICKQSVLGKQLGERDLWRRRTAAAVFRHFRVRGQARKKLCRRGRLFDALGVRDLPELVDLKKSGWLWEDEKLPGLKQAYERTLRQSARLSERVREALDGQDVAKLRTLLDRLTRRALASLWPKLPLLIVDEIHGLKNEQVKARGHLERMCGGRVSRMLGLSATPFQLRHGELLSLLKLRSLLAVDKSRARELDEAVVDLEEAMTAARERGEEFRRRWAALRPGDGPDVLDAWKEIMDAPRDGQVQAARQARPPRVAHALVTALTLAENNEELTRHLAPFVIRHHHARGYREHFVGRTVEAATGQGSGHFGWAPGMEVRGDDELAHYLMMRAVALAKDEKGLPGLGAELTGSYRHLVETAAVWRCLEKATNPLLRDYRSLLDRLIGRRTDADDPDSEHCKVRATVRRALEFFKAGQKTLVFCVYTKTAEAVRDQLQAAIDAHLHEVRDRVFGGENAFENFRRRFFNRREPLFSAIQDQPLLGPLPGGAVGVPGRLRLPAAALEEVARLLLDRGEPAGAEKPDRRLILAAVEHVAVRAWRASAEGRKWLDDALKACPNVADQIAATSWLDGRDPLSRSGRSRRPVDPETVTADPLDVEEADEGSGGRDVSVPGEVADWVRRLREDAIGEVVAPYISRGAVVGAPGERLPLPARHHVDLLARLDLETRAVTGHVFRRVLMAEEFLLRYLADAQRESSERWADYLSERYDRPLDGHRESLRDRFHAYLETLVRASGNKSLLAGYRAAAENRNVVQLVRGDTQERDRYFLGFNTPYRPEILVSTSVGQEGIDLHRECRHVIHHDLCWNPATIEQRTGRVDRIGSKVERERLGVDGSSDGDGIDGAAPTLEIAVPYLAATYDERMFEELYRRARLFEVTMGGDFRVDGRAEAEHDEQRRRERLGIGTQDEDLGEESAEAGAIDLPDELVDRLRVDLAVWKPG